MQFSNVAVVVSDAKKARTWYTETLGFEPREDEGHWVTVAPKGASVTLHLCQTQPPEKGNTGVGFTAKDVAKLEAELRRKGVAFSQSAQKLPWGTVAKFLDPDGNEFWLTQE